MNDLIVNDDKDLETVKVSFELLESKSEEQTSCEDKQVLESLLEGITSEEDLLVDFSKADKYLCICKKVRLKVNTLIQ